MPTTTVHRPPRTPSAIANHLQDILAQLPQAVTFDEDADYGARLPQARDYDVGWRLSAKVEQVCRQALQLLQEEETLALRDALTAAATHAHVQCEAYLEEGGRLRRRDREQAALLQRHIQGMERILPKPPEPTLEEIARQESEFHATGGCSREEG